MLARPLEFLRNTLTCDEHTGDHPERAVPQRCLRLTAAIPSMASNDDIPSNAYSPSVGMLAGVVEMRGRC